MTETLMDDLDGEEIPPVGIVKAKLEIKDVAGDTKTKEYSLPYHEELEEGADALQEFNKEVEEKVKQGELIKYFDETIRGDNVISYKVTRVRE